MGRADLKNKDSHLKDLMRKMQDAAAEKSNISLSVDELKQKLEKKDEELETLQTRMKDEVETEASQALASEAIQAAMAVQEVEVLLEEKESEMEKVARQTAEFDKEKNVQQKTIKSLQSELETKNIEIREVAEKFEHQLNAMKAQKDTELAALEKRMTEFSEENSSTNMETSELRKALVMKQADIKRMEDESDVAMRRLTLRKDSELREMADKKNKELSSLAYELEEVTIKKIELESEVGKLKLKMSEEQLALVTRSSDVERMATDKERSEATIQHLRHNILKEEAKVREANAELERKRAAAMRESALQQTMITGLKEKLSKKDQELKDVHTEVTRRIGQYNKERTGGAANQKMMDLLKSRLEKKDRELKEVHLEVARRIEQGNLEKSKNRDAVEKMRVKLKEREGELETVAESMQQWKVQTAVSLAKELKDKIASELGARKKEQEAKLRTRVASAKKD